MVAQIPSSPPAPITPPAEAPSHTPAEPRELYDPSTGRTWPRAFVDRLLVGRIHGGYDWTQSSLHLGLAHPSDFTDVTELELERFWTDVVPRTTLLAWWGSREADDADVRTVLDDIQAVMDAGQEFFERNFGVEREASPAEVRMVLDEIQAVLDSGRGFFEMDFGS